MMKKILVPVDLEESPPGWLGYAFDLARELSAEVLLLHVVDYVPVVLPVQLPEGHTFPQVALVQEAASRKLRAVADGVGDLKVRPMVEVGAAAPSIVEAAVRHGVDHIVVGSHSRGGLVRAVLGSVAERVARTAPCPVTIVRMRPED